MKVFSYLIGILAVILHVFCMLLVVVGLAFKVLFRVIKKWI